MVLYFMLQWNPGLTICQGSVKMISLNRDIVIVEFSVIKGKFLKISLYRDNG